jgi:hypothetical protein
MSRLFYGKCYVTIVIRELSRSPIAIWESFFDEKKLSQIIFIHRKLWFLFLFVSPSFSNRSFFGAIYLAAFYIFF